MTDMHWKILQCNEFQIFKPHEIIKKVSFYDSTFNYRMKKNLISFEMNQKIEKLKNFLSFYVILIIIVPKKQIIDKEKNLRSNFRSVELTFFFFDFSRY